ncbi:MAG TPA: glycoside hydrolase domain-containing protein [Opitutaceae bacterium]|nr:glycoside hydrolase domain-containing protein [Opitutaceae bacterium]
MRLPSILALLAVCVPIAGRAAVDRSPVEWIDPFIGTGETALPPAEGIAANWAWLKPKHGQLHPGATVPFGLVSVVPYGAGYPTGYWRGVEGGPCTGFTHFQQSGTGAIGKYYNFVRVAPVRGELSFAKPRYTLTDEKASPGYYQARIADAGIDAEVTVARRTAFHRYVFTGDAPAHLVIDLAQAYDGFNAKKVARPTEAEFLLTAPNIGEGHVVIDGLPLYFHLEVDGTPDASGAWAGEEKTPGTGPHGLSEKPFGLWFSFPRGTHSAQLRIVFSFKSVAQARATLTEEMPSTDFAAAVGNARTRWEKYLERIRIEGGTADERTLFYTALYRALIKPSDASGENPFWESSLPWYVDYATLWDIYKTEAPLLMTFYPERGRDIANGLLNIAEHHGRFPVGYLLPNELRFDDQGIDFAQIILADAWQKRVPGIDWPRAFPQLVAGLKSSGHYVDTALQYAYASACLVPIAEKLKDEKTASALRAQSETWRHALDAKTHKLPPTPGAAYGYSLYEGGVWNYSFTVWQDMPGLIGLYSSREAFVQELDRFFGYGSIEGVDIPFEGLNNQPDMEVPYAYIFAGRPHRTQEVIHAVRKYRFAVGRGGWPGNDDSGATSSWYVWNALGLFPIAGRDLYLIGTPQFPRANFEIGGKSFTIEAVDVSAENFYIQSAELDGKPLDRAWLTYDELAQGGHLILKMGAHPSRWGAAHPPR